MTWKTTRWLIATLCLAAARPALAHPVVVDVARAQAMLIKEDLGDGVFVFRAPETLDIWTSTNTVVVINDEDVVVFDSATRAVTAKAVIAEVRKLTPKPVTVVINSHWHQDHWSGNDEFARAFPGLRIIASEETRDYMKRMPPRFFIRGLEIRSQKEREELAAAARTGKLADGKPLTPEVRASKEADLATRDQFIAEVIALPRVLPNVVYKDEMSFWSGKREFRLMTVTGDAMGSTVLYLPGSKVLATGDVLVSPEDGNGPPPWTCNSYAVTAWLNSLRRLNALDLAAIVPGQGPTMHDKAYLRRTIELFAAVIDQVHAALESGAVGLEQVQAAVNVDQIGTAYAPGTSLDGFHQWVASFSKKATQEALDGDVEDE